MGCRDNLRVPIKIYEMTPVHLLSRNIQGNAREDGYLRRQIFLSPARLQQRTNNSKKDNKRNNKKTNKL